MATKKTTVKKTVVKKTTAKKTSTSAAKPKAKKAAETKGKDHALVIAYGDDIRKAPKMPIPPPPQKHHIPLDGANPLATAKAIIEAGDFSTKNIKFVLTTIMRELAIVKAR